MVEMKNCLIFLGVPLPCLRDLWFNAILQKQINSPEEIVQKCQWSRIFPEMLFFWLCAACASNCDNNIHPLEINV